MTEVWGMTLEPGKPMGPDIHKDVLDVEEVAELLHCSVRTVERLPLPYSKVARKRLYLREDVLNHLRKRAS